jgi:hypothetical protein
MFQEWLDTFIDEKDLDRDQVLTLDFIETVFLVEFEVLINFLKGLDPETQQSIKRTFVKIDFMNGDAMSFFRYLAEGMVTL